MLVNQHMKIKPIPISLALAALLIGLTPLLMLGHAKAAVLPFQQAFLRLDNLNATSASGGRVCVKPSTGNAAQTIASIKVTFPTTGGTDYVVNGTAANWTVTTTNLDTGQTAMPTIATANNVTGKAVTFPLGTPQVLSSSNLYCFNFASASTLTTSSAGAAETTQGNIASQIAGPTVEDQTTYSESIISNDQVTVTAIVPPSFSFVLNGNTDSFATPLSTTTTVSTGSVRTITIITNAPSGWVVWAQDTNFKTVTDAGSNPANEHGALKSATASNYVISNNTASTLGTASHSMTNGTEDYGLAITTAGGSSAPDAAYDGAATKVGVLDPTKFRPIATSTTTANSDVVTLNERATIAGQTPAASDYTDIITFIGAGRF